MSGPAQRKLTPEQVRTIRMWWRVREEAMKVPVPRIVAQRFDVCVGTLYQIARGHRYKDVQ
jgi:hypothetical protein